MNFVFLSRQMRHDQLSWDLKVSLFPHLEKEEARRDTLNQLNEITAASFQRNSALDLVGDRDRIQMIGSNLSRHGDQWASNHPRWMRWLQEKGITRENAVAAFEKWNQEEMDNPFWDRNRKG